jgi:hypothetical protein
VVVREDSLFWSFKRPNHGEEGGLEEVEYKLDYCHADALPGFEGGMILSAVVAGLTNHFGLEVGVHWATRGRGSRGRRFLSTETATGPDPTDRHATKERE